MAFQTATFQSILDMVAESAGIGYADAQTRDKKRWTSFANTGMEWMWRPPNRMFAFDFSVTTATITITDGKFDASEIDYADWWNLWTQDPRPYQVAGGTWPNVWPLRVRAFADGAGVWPQTEQATVFAFYRTAKPRLTSTVVVGATTYAAGAVVYDEDATGDCYVALVSALGSALSDDTKWERQLIPAVLAEPMSGLIEAQLQNTLGIEGKSRNAKAEANEWLDIEMMRQMPRDGTGPPWAYNGAGNYYDMAGGR